MHLTSTDRAGAFVHWPDAKNALGVSLVGLLNVMWELEHNDRQYVIIASTEGPVTTLEWAVVSSFNLPTTKRKVQITEPNNGNFVLSYLEKDKAKDDYNTVTIHCPSGTELAAIKNIYTFLVEGVLMEYEKNAVKQG